MIAAATLRRLIEGLQLGRAQEWMRNVLVVWTRKKMARRGVRSIAGVRSQVQAITGTVLISKIL
jgi:hypothetical protein